MGKRENELAVEVDQFVDDYMELRRLVVETQRAIVKVKKAMAENKASLKALIAKTEVAPTEDNPGIIAGNMYTLVVMPDNDNEGEFNIGVKMN
jgi:lipopolysaccharide biosynthesis regulator YciM